MVWVRLCSRVKRTAKAKPSNTEWMLIRKWVFKGSVLTKAKLLFVVTLLLLFSILYINWYPIKIQCKIFTQQETIVYSAKPFIQEQNSYMGTVSNRTITQLSNKKIYIIAAYFDNRDQNIIRIIAIVHHKNVTEIYCWLHCQARRGYLSIKRAVADVHTDRFGFPYGATDVLCWEPPDCDPKYVSVHWSSEGDSDQLPVFEIQNRNPQQISANFTICISTLFGNYSNILQVIQTIEMYKLLGAQRVMIYKNNCSASLQRVLQYYIEEGTVEVVPWPITEYLQTTTAWNYSMDPKDIGYYGQQTALNDCIYRNMYRSKYVMLNDLDEIILPYQHQNWSSMMESLQKQYPNIDIFLFENHVFPVTEFTSTDKFDTSLWRSVPGEDILQHVLREPDRPKDFNDRKMILNPRKVIQTSVHSVLKAHGKSEDIPMDVAIVYHCRSPRQPDLPKSSLISDRNIWNYSLSLIANVNDVLTKTKQINLK